MGNSGGRTVTWSTKTLKEFQDALASSDPTPGGGSAAAVALGQAAALAVMVSELTLAKESLSGGWSISEHVRSVAEPFLKTGLELATSDSDAFDAVVASFRLPRETDEDKGKRRDAIRLATLGAAEVPYQTATSALQLLRLLPKLAAKGNPNAASDVMARYWRMTGHDVLHPIGTHLVCLQNNLLSKQVHNPGTLPRRIFPISNAN